MENLGTILNPYDLDNEVKDVYIYETYIGIEVGLVVIKQFQF